MFWFLIKIGCHTTSGPVPNATCIFPFMYNNASHETCIRSRHTPDKYVCPTRVNKYGSWYDKEWGYCGSRCIPYGMIIISILRRILAHTHNYIPLNVKNQ